MSDRDGFVKAILNDPFDDTVRLVYADWLDEHNQPEHAAFIRTQIGANREFPDHVLEIPKRDIYTFDTVHNPSRYHMVTETVWRAWQAWRVKELATSVFDVASLVPGSMWVRGFMIVARLSGNGWIENGDGIMSEHPIEDVVLSSMYDIDLVRTLQQTGWPVQDMWWFASTPDRRISISEFNRVGDYLNEIGDPRAYRRAALNLRWPGVRFYFPDETYP